ncbi:MAG TPA: pitrilysin family protein [Candidatus Saccharimonadales bacterium]|nr:pitrilysin family protein [Candidatus Saccharimonadales bacterium]
MKHSVEEVVLTNGSRGLLIHVPNATVMSYDFEFRAGHDYCPKDDIYETPHIMEHMVLGANETYQNARQFNAELEKNGAYSNASTSSASLKYVADCADFEWDRVLDLLRLAITKPLFLQSEFEAEYGNVKEELTGYLSNNGRVLWQRIGQASGEHFFNDDQRLKTMPQIKLKDIKEHYYRTHTSDNLRFIIVGNLKDDRKATVVKMLEKWDLPRGERFGLVREELVGAQTPIHIVRKDVENLIFGFSVQANWRMPDNEADAMAALNHMLTGSLHSAIYGRARENGLAYSVWSDFVVSDSASEWDFGGQVSLKNAPKLFAIVAEEVKKVMSGQLTVAEINTAKQFALGKHQMGCQTVGSIASWYARRYYFDGYIDTYQDRPKAIAAVDKAIIIKAASDLIDGKRWAFGGLGNVQDAQMQSLHTQLGTIFE